MSQKPIINEPLMLAITSDIAGKVRGKSFPLRQFEKRLKRGVGWTPTNVQITCFDSIAESPFGALGDLVLIPDPSTRVEVDYQDGLPVERFVIGNIRKTDQTAWEFCTRSILQSALERLVAVSGIHLYGAFEHEFHFVDAGSVLGRAYTSDGFRSQRSFAEALFSAMDQADLKPDTFMKEYGIDQFEVTAGPVSGIAIADQGTIIRELVKITAERFGLRASFAPLRSPSGVGNGVHIHMSLRDDKNRSITHDPNSRHGLSDIAGRFVAGILKYLDRVVALTAPSVASYTRLTPHRWSAAYNNLGFRDRESAVRICPVSDLSDVSVADQFNFEFRASDAASSPYLCLAALVHAGAQGIEEHLSCPEATEEDLSLLSVDALRKKGIVRLPDTLASALDCFRQDDTVRSWFPADFADVYVKHKLGEMACLEGKTETEICAAYESAY